jgi:hypothetical protein
MTVFLVQMVSIRTKSTVGARERASPLVACDGIQDAAYKPLDAAAGQTCCRSNCCLKSFARRM